MERKSSFASNIFLVIIFFILYAPIFYLIFYSFNSGGTMSGFEGFTLDWYKELLHDTRLLIIVLNTLVIALLSALISTVIGVLGAIGIHAYKRRQTKNTLLALNNILVVSPDVIIGASFLILFTMAGIQLGFYSVLLSLSAVGLASAVSNLTPQHLALGNSRGAAQTLSLCLRLFFSERETA